MITSARFRGVVVLIMVEALLVSCTDSVGQDGRVPDASTSVPILISTPTSTEAPEWFAAVTSTETLQFIPPTVAAEVTQTFAATSLAGFAFPSEIDLQARYLFYLHGKIIEEQGLPAISPQYGEYRYVEILQALESHGFVVISEQRGEDIDAMSYVRRVTRQMRQLLEAGVPAGSITVVGASKGAAIAVMVSSLAKNSEINYVLLGTCHPDQIEEWKQQQTTLYGNVLAIFDSADEYAGSCEKLFASSDGIGLGRHAEIILDIGTGHGILYQPLDEWILPTVHWALGN